MKLRHSRRVSTCLTAAVLVTAIAAVTAITALPSAAATATSATTASALPWDAGQPPAWMPPSDSAAYGWGTGAGAASWLGEPDSSRIEYFHVVSTRPSGPGTIILTGVINAGGTEHPGRAIDRATFNEGTFRIDHSAGQPTSHFDPSTCVGTITQYGPFKVIDTTGGLRDLAGSGHYSFRALYTTARVAGHCTSTMTAYAETINGVATVK